MALMGSIRFFPIRLREKCVPLEQSKKLALTRCPPTQLSANEPCRAAGDRIGLILTLFNIAGYGGIEDAHSGPKKL